MEKRLEDYENDPQVKLVILKGNGKAFCAGGDNVAIYKFLTAGDWSFGASYFNKLFTLQYLASTYKKPLVAILDGVVMGGGAAVSMLANFKIVTENTVFAVPEAALGSSIGDSYSLSRLSGHFGEYLGLTGAQIDGAEMIECGLATHFVFSKEKEMGNGDDEKWIIDSVNLIKSCSPLSLKVSLKLANQDHLQRWLISFSRKLGLEANYVASLESLYGAVTAAWCVGPLLLYDQIEREPKTDQPPPPTSTTSWTKWLNQPSGRLTFQLGLKLICVTSRLMNWLMVWTCLVFTTFGRLNQKLGLIIV
ncbi:hypothetical protein LWI28_023131 [Acer negundo]|uniref:3-hydroxyisobutyryl-CoA hydrolase n=1 Tax=Acer negundo TaxID=4023 RepID=A0AAD5JAU0_ACENE|nr:hypothetical protein LWI28_023131 [Acer negundo]